MILMTLNIVFTIWKLTTLFTIGRCPAGCIIYQLVFSIPLLTLFDKSGKSFKSLQQEKINLKKSISNISDNNTCLYFFIVEYKKTVLV